MNSLKYTFRPSYGSCTKVRNCLATSTSLVLRSLIRIRSITFTGALMSLRKRIVQDGTYTNRATLPFRFRKTSQYAFPKTSLSRRISIRNLGKLQPWGAKEKKALSLDFSSLARSVISSRRPRTSSSLGFSCSRVGSSSFWSASQALSARMASKTFSKAAAGSSKSTTFSYLCPKLSMLTM